MRINEYDQATLIRFFRCCRISRLTEDVIKEEGIAQDKFGSSIYALINESLVRDLIEAIHEVMIPHWDKGLPTEEGYYWLHGMLDEMSTKTETILIEVDKDGYIVSGILDEDAVKESWYTPAFVPEYKEGVSL